VESSPSLLRPTVHGRFKIESAYDLLICGRVCNLAG
jgi:hypothetical protein